MLDHSTSLGVEDSSTVEVVVPSVEPVPTQDADVLGVNLREDWECPRREVGDIDENPCLRPHP